MCFYVNLRELWPFESLFSRPSNRDKGKGNTRRNKSSSSKDSITTTKSGNNNNNNNDNNEQTDVDGKLRQWNKTELAPHWLTSEADEKTHIIQSSIGLLPGYETPASADNHHHQQQTNQQQRHYGSNLLESLGRSRAGALDLVDGCGLFQKEGAAVLSNARGGRGSCLVDRSELDTTPATTTTIITTTTNQGQAVGIMSGQQVSNPTANNNNLEFTQTTKQDLASSVAQQQQQQQQQQTTTSSAQSRINEMKSVSQHSSFSEFNNNSDALDQDDLKPMTNYANQNGQANYWMGTNQQTTMSSQPTSSSSSSRLQHNNSNNGNNVNALSRTNNYINREDVKTANRLSSDTDNETDRLLGSQRNDQLQKMASNDLVSNNNNSNSNEQQAANNNFSAKQGTNSREVLIEGVLFNVKYLGSTHTECEGRGEKEDRIHQAELAVHEVKFRNGETHSPVEVQLFISTEKIMVLDDKHRKIMMDHSLRTISYIADIGDAIVLIVRKKSTSLENNNDLGRPVSKTSCHVFESNESHTITKSISQAFQVAYTELLKANGGGDGSNYLPKELDYQEVLNSQEMSTTELEMFARKDNQREVIVPKKKGEILGLSIVESGWGSVLPTAVIASLKPDGPAYRCKKLSIGDQILSINGISLVGLSLAECQKILRKTKNQSVARLSVVPCPITVEVKIKRPDTKYQLGFSVQHGVIISLLRGGIAERGGVRVGHRIISINGTTVVGVAHDKIVTMLASSVGEIRMKTCLTSLYRHMLGEEKNVSFV